MVRDLPRRPERVWPGSPTRPTAALVARRLRPRFRPARPGTDTRNPRRWPGRRRDAHLRTITRTVAPLGQRHPARCDLLGAARVAYGHSS